MLMLATFVAAGLSGEPPRITVERFRTETYMGGHNSEERTRKTCEDQGELYKKSLEGTLPNGTTLTITCLPETYLK